MRFHVYGTAIRDGVDDQGRTKYRPEVTIALTGADGTVVAQHSGPAAEAKAFGLTVADVANSTEWQAALAQALGEDDKSDEEILQLFARVDVIRNARLGNYRRA